MTGRSQLWYAVPAQGERVEIVLTEQDDGRWSALAQAGAFELRTGPKRDALNALLAAQRELGAALSSPIFELLSEHAPSRAALVAELESLRASQTEHAALRAESREIAAAVRADLATVRAEIAAHRATLGSGVDAADALLDSACEALDRVAPVPGHGAGCPCAGCEAAAVARLTRLALRALVRP